MDERAGTVVINGVHYTFAVSNKIPSIDFPKLFEGWMDLYFKDANGNEATVNLKPDETVVGKITETVLLRKW